MKINWIRKISAQGHHNAFTDLCQFKQDFYCCFRQAENHVSDDGTIIVLKLTLQGKVAITSRLHLDGHDLRDPKLSETPDGKLLLIAYARSTKRTGTVGSSRNICWISQDGLSWSSPTYFGRDNWWLWRVRWNKAQAFGFAYNRGQNAIDLYQGDPRRTFDKIVSGAFNKEKHHKAYPNESDLLFIEQQCFAIVRRDADTYSAQLGHSSYPYKQWHWLDLGFYLGGPVMLPLNNSQGLLAGRVIHKNSLRTAIFKIVFKTGKTSDFLLLPSKGDNSYPGLVRLNNLLYVSYYSSHEDDKASIYLAQLDL